MKHLSNTTKKGHSNSAASAVPLVSQRRTAGATKLFIDRRPRAVAQRKLQDSANSSSYIRKSHTLQLRVTTGASVAQRVDYISKPMFLNDEDELEPWTSDMAESSIMDDDFDTAIKPLLTQPTPDDEIATAIGNGQHRDVVLWRSMQTARLEAILAHNSAGGEEADANIGPPTHQQQQDQIAIGGQVPEFTSNPDVSSFSWRARMAVVRINTRYLYRGSASESGWISNRQAPLVILDTVDRRVGLPEMALFGAA